MKPLTDHSRSNIAVRDGEQGTDAGAQVNLSRDLCAIPVEEICVDELLPADSPRQSGEDTDHVRALAETQAELPPILVHRPTMRVIDGMHRVAAARLSGAGTIRARLIECSDHEVFILAVKSNVAHGMPLTLADRKTAARRVLLAHPAWSDRAIGEVTGLSHKTVGAIRRRSSGEIPQSGPRIGRDGRVRAVARRAEPGPVLRTAQKAPAEPEPAVDSGGLPVDRQRARLRSLMKDPSLTLSESGRSLLRLLVTRAVHPHDWEDLVLGVPPHCVGAVAELAAHYASCWQRFEEGLRSHSSPVD
ncbi:ParB/RepB/Spo0J family partition protein [Streptomyces sp. XM4011]|uniref:ParB/RepB/Spo0J family partition protein n=1 Tax=Streptomyces sp. XM4011 TaxID=2929780 RepID=UPI001FF8DA73|nr:ParB/RepB/Spo0J family partition protein [Streptomyces sp. XM4011]MCK1815699.1 ParB/RepB/Spo0J family partition protein [Streptomyces sp. XM4011]